MERSIEPGWDPDRRKSMEISGWENFFEPHIRMRGETYFEHELVHGLKIGKEEISAVVEGTKPYNVRITLKNRTITGLFCTCPYADGGYACKHIAAVFCAVEKEPDPQPDPGADPGQGEGPEPDCRDLQREDTGASELVEAVRSLSEAKAKELLAEVAYRYPEFRTRLLAACGRMSGQDLRKAWERDLNGITREAAGRDEFIDWHSAGAYASRLCEYLDDTVCELIDGAELDAAFDLIELVFKEVLSVDIDDDGDIEFVAEDCCKYWKAIISHPESNQIDLFERIQRLAPESETGREDDWDDDNDWEDEDDDEDDDDEDDEDD